MIDAKIVIARYPRDCQPIHVEPLGSAGGLSGAQFWRLVAPRGTLVLRCWPIEHPTPADLQFIHAVLPHAARRGITFVPVPIASTEGATFISHAGHLWELAPWLSGVADYERSPSVEKLRAAMTALARFHIAVADWPTTGGLSVAASPPAIARRLARLRDLQSGGIERLANSITDRTWPDLAPLARQIIAALPHAVPIAINQLAPLADVSLPLQPCIRDIWHDHVLFDGDCVTGLIDFGAMQIDTPATDIARLLGSLTSYPLPIDGEGCRAANNTWPIALAAYSTLRPVSDQETQAITALDTSGTILAGCNWILWIYIDARQFENHNQIVERFRRIMLRLREFATARPIEQLWPTRPQATRFDSSGD